MALIFPQLQSGAVAQLPLARLESYRTLRNALSDGSVIQISDTGFEEVGWTLKYSELNADEVQALQSLFQSAAGRLNTFTFVDPSANLLSWSDDLTQAVWTADPELALTSVGDAFGGTAGTQIANGSAAVQSISQTTNAPGALQYCFSAYLRTDMSAAEVTFEIGGTAVLTAAVTGTWQRRQAVATGGTGTQVVFGLALAPGVTVQVCGLQVEAQPAVGVYKSTTATSSVFTSSRFDQDSMNVTATDAGLFGCSVRIVSQL
jgi:hypothetical protein